MGSKYRLLPHLERTFAEIGGTTAVDAFSGSGVVSYLLKAQGFSVASNDFLNFPNIIARATVANSSVRLESELIDEICGPPLDDRDFIRSTFDGLYFDAADRAFLDSAWSHIARLRGYRRDLAISALVLSAARKQPRGVFTFTDSTRYADGRRDLRMSLRDHFRLRAASEYNSTVFSNGRKHRSSCGDVFDLDVTPLFDAAPDLVYLDPPYAPPTDDNDYIKRYHFLEGLSVYWEGMSIMRTPRPRSCRSGSPRSPTNGPSTTPWSAHSSTSRTRARSCCPTRRTLCPAPTASSTCWARSSRRSRSLRSTTSTVSAPTPPRRVAT